MTARIRHGLTYANVLSTIALFVALGGGAYAAARIGPDDIKRNAVRSKHIKKNQVGRKHLKRGAVSTPKLVAGAVTAAKLANASVTGPKLADGSVTGPKVDESTLGIVPNADLIDGVDSGDLMRGSGRARAVRGTDAPSASPSAPFVLGDGELTLDCNNPASAGSDFVFKNTSGSTADVWTDKVQYTFAPAHQIFHSSVPNGGNASVSVSGPSVLDGSALVKFTASTPGRLTLIEARIVFSAGNCLFNAAATELPT